MENEDYKKKMKEMYGTEDFTKIYHKNYTEFVPVELIDEVSTELFDSLYYEQMANTSTNYNEFRSNLIEKIRITVNRNKAIDIILK